MKKGYLFLTLLSVFVLSSLTAFAQPKFSLVKGYGGTGADNGTSIAVDSIGRMYVTGLFSGTVTIVPGKTLTSAGNIDYLLMKLDSKGNPIWAKGAGGTITDQGNSVKLDKNGNVITGLHYYGTANFGTGNVTSMGNWDAAIAKYDTAGNILWLREVKDTAQSSIRDIAVDNSNNIIAVGYFGSNTNKTASFGTTKIFTAGQRDIFIAKYDNAGNLIWVKQAGGIAAGDEPENVAVDAENNIYLTGSFTDSASFGNIKVKAVKGGDIFVAKYDAQGNSLWVRTGGSIGADKGRGISLDNNSNVYVTGYFDSLAYFGTTKVLGNDANDIFIAKYNAQGDLQWVNWAGSEKSDVGYSVAADPAGGCFVSGYFNGTINVGTQSFTSKGAEDAIFLKYTSDGQFDGGKTAGGAAKDYGMAITIDRVKNVYATGYFTATKGFFDTDTLTSKGADDIFVVKIGDSPIPVELSSFSGKVKGTAVELNWLTATEKNNAGFEVERSSDNVNFQRVAFVKGYGTTSEKHSYSFVDTKAGSGKFYYRLKQIDLNGTYSYSNVISVKTGLPSAYVLRQNYPNPFNPATRISFDMPQEGFVKLTIYNAIGQMINMPVNGRFAAGSHEISFNGSSLVSGIYFYSIEVKANDGSIFNQTKKMTLIK